jgi:hypothetical protein
MDAAHNIIAAVSGLHALPHHASPQHILPNRSSANRTKFHAVNSAIFGSPRTLLNEGEF